MRSLRALVVVSSLAALLALPTSAGASSARFAGITCGGTWQIVPSPTIGTGSNELSAVLWLGRSDAWAVGSAAPQPRDGTILHWNGISWGVERAPVPPPAVNEYLTGISGVTNNVWAAGWWEDVRGALHTLTLHYNGSTWRVVPSPDPQGAKDARLYAITAGPNGTWAVGDWLDPTTSSYAPLVEHWTPSGWVIVPSPNPNPGSGSTTSLHGVAAAAPNLAWAVGFSSTPTGGEALLETWDGTQWNAVADPTFSDDTVSAASPTDAMTLGGLSSDYWDGSTWTPEPLAPPSVGNAYLDAISVGTFGAWAVGSQGGDGHVETLVERWDGVAWTTVPSPNRAGERDVLQGVSANATGQAWAVGFYRDNSGLDHTLIELYC